MEMKSLKSIKLLAAMGLASLLPLSANAAPDVGMGSLTQDAVEVQANDIATYETNLRAALLAIEATAAVGNDLDDVYRVKDYNGTTLFTITPTNENPGTSDFLTVVIQLDDTSNLNLGPFTEDGAAGGDDTKLTYTPKLADGNKVALADSSNVDIVDRSVIASWDCEITNASTVNLPYAITAGDDIIESIFVLAGGVYASCHI